MIATNPIDLGVAGTRISTFDQVQPVVNLSLQDDGIP